MGNLGERLDNVNWNAMKLEPFERSFYQCVHFTRSMPERIRRLEVADPPFDWCREARSVASRSNSEVHQLLQHLYET